MKTVRDLLNIDYDIEITGIAEDSRDVKEGFLYVATKGFNVDHFDYIDKAIEAGCVFLVVDREISFSFPHLVVENIDQFFKDLCLKFYDIDLDKMRFIGITGTDGKTTTASIVHEIIKNSAYIGTNGLTIREETYPTNNTTPCFSELSAALKKVQEASLDTVVMEVSSEALLHDRVSNLIFDIVGFTNITGDHLNVHGTFEQYVQAKMKLLDLKKSDGVAIVNGDDEILKEIPNSCTFGFHEDNDYVIELVENEDKNTIITLSHHGKQVIIHSPFFGRYNVYNVVQAYLIAKEYGISEDEILNTIQNLKPIKGRGERLDFGQDYTIVLDYAHTINGIENILEAYSDYDEIITLTGCAGGREKEKRPVIGKMIMEKSDIAVFTMDDPRTEDVNDIIDDMVGDAKDYIRIPDREEAIAYALSIAHKGSVVLIIGKGRDNYMAIGDKKVPYNDYDVIKNYFENKKI